MVQQRSRALTVLRAVVRLKLLSERATRELEDEGVVEPSGNGAYDTEQPKGNSGTQTPLLSAAPSLSRRMSMSSVIIPRTARSWILSDLSAIRELLLHSWVNVLLLAIPFALAAGFLKWSPAVVFTLNFISLIPLALTLGDVTEDLAIRFGDVVGGLINATFGNVVEIILSLAALLKGLYLVVAMSLLGSILSNVLLVLGCSFFFGGLRYKTQTFNAVGNRACSSLLMLSCVGVIIPTAFTSLSKAGDPHDQDWGLQISRWTAVLLLIGYVCYLIFQLGTHKDLFEGEDSEEEPMLSIVSAIGMLTIITVIVAFCSEFLTGSIEAVSASSGLGQAFLGIIVLPIAGNACEHITAVMVAMKNKMDLSIGVALGSSIQIALLAIPLAVIFGWITGHPFSLAFDPFSVVALLVSVIHVNSITNDATSHWMLGVQLIIVYCLIATAYLWV